MDVHSKEVRSYNMSCIKGKGTKPEEIVRKYLFSQGFRYRKNVKRLPGTPDIVLPKYKTVIFVNGCFWHMHEGDKRDYTCLEKSGWRVIVVWECSLKASRCELSLKLLSESIKENYNVAVQRY